MTQMDLFPTAQSSQPDIRANRLALLETEEAKMMTDISGQKYLPLLKQNDPLGAFSKTFLATSLWVSTKCYLIWRGKTTPQGRLLFQLAPLTHPTEETEFGLSQKMWRTPDTGQGGTSGLLKEGKTHRENGQPIQVRLVDQVNNPKLWPTPTASDNRDRGCMEDPSIKRRIKIGKQIGLTTAVKETRSSGSLNPQWVEWLMGYPEGWTDLEG